MGPFKALVSDIAGHIGCSRNFTVGLLYRRERTVVCYGSVSDPASYDMSLPKKENKNPERKKAETHLSPSSEADDLSDPRSVPGARLRSFQSRMYNDVKFYLGG